MNEEFTKHGVNKAISLKGFTVMVKPMGGVLYVDNKRETQIDSEWLVKPPRILLYKAGFKMDQPYVENMFSNVVRALEYLGHRVEVWSPPPDECGRSGPRS